MRRMQLILNVLTNCIRILKTRYTAEDHFNDLLMSHFTNFKLL